MINLAFLIPLFPLLAFPVLILSGYRYRERAHWVTIGALILSTILSLGVFSEVARGVTQSIAIPWFPFGVAGFSIGIRVDPLAALMCVVVTIISTLIQIYSIGYMRSDPRIHRYYAYMALFSAAMLGLVLADNWLLLYACWELVGLGSYLLIGFWFEKPEAAKAAKKAFITTRIGDVGLALAILLLFATTGSVEMSKIFHLAETGVLTPVLAGGAALLVFIGAMGKSAQFPLHIWLPDAMEGPTPVSALIHAATMVAAGVYLVARSAPLFAAASGTPVALIIGIIATITLLMAGAIAMTATDIKRILAYSTISQLGYMMLGLSAGGVVASIFHLATHAFFKALLFLCAGSVIHAAHTQDLFQMGGLGRKMRITAATMGIGAISLIGIPPFAGFWSKDEILVTVFRAFPILGILGLLGVFMTAFYISRLFLLAFIVPSKKETHAHESPAVMTIPLVVLAALSLIVGLWGSPWLGMKAQSFLSGGVSIQVHSAGNFSSRPAGTSPPLPISPSPHLLPPLRPSSVAAGRFPTALPEQLPGGMMSHEPAHAGGTLPLWISAFSVLCGVFGMILAWAVYGARWLVPEKALGSLQGLYIIAKNKFYVDEVVTALILVPGKVLTHSLASFDLRIVDGFVNLVGRVTIAFSVINCAFDTVVVDGVVNGVAWVTTEFSRVLRVIQTGFAQNYLLVLFAGVFVLVVSQIMK